ncbi:Hpt domain-containing protein [Bradyrhizobium sp.]|uniref:Hpt domain-containing protein n=1 Tax=Bradyrhizobium sp. TaxID=376 RepID=UPI003C3B76F9
MNDAPICNKAVYLEFCGDVGPEDAAEVLGAFLEDTLSKMSGLASLADRSVLKREAHSIKSSSATFGFERLSGLARQLEFGADAMSPAEVENAIAAIKHAFEATAGYARKELLEANLLTL